MSIRRIGGLLAVIGVLALILAIAVWQRHYLLFIAFAEGKPPELLEFRPEVENAGVRWHDDYFMVEAIDERTFAIGEPRYLQQNFSYLIVGDARAVLFDAGPGFQDIRAVAESLTDLPILFVPSHFHFDHTGNEITFDEVAVVDLPYLRERAPDNQLELTWQEHLGATEGVDAPTLAVSQWLAIGSDIDLGGRELRVLHTPGHTTDSISLLDRSSGAVFTGDFIYPGPLYAFLPTSDLGEYADGTDTLLGNVAATAPLFGAHRDRPPGVPTLGLGDVRDLKAALEGVANGQINGERDYPVSYPVNERVQLLVEPSYLQP